MPTAPGAVSAQRTTDIAALRARACHRYLARAKANRQRAEETRERARLEREHAVSRRREDATSARSANDRLATEARGLILAANRRQVRPTSAPARTLILPSPGPHPRPHPNSNPNPDPNPNRRQVADEYSRRFASRRVAARWEGSPLRALVGLRSPRGHASSSTATALATMPGAAQQEDEPELPEHHAPHEQLEARRPRSARAAVLSGGGRVSSRAAAAAPAGSRESRELERQAHHAKWEDKHYVAAASDGRAVVRC